MKWTFERSASGQPYTGSKGQGGPVDKDGWPMCPLHQVVGHMVGSVTCQQTPIQVLVIPGVRTPGSI